MAKTCSLSFYRTSRCPYKVSVAHVKSRLLSRYSSINILKHHLVIRHQNPVEKQRANLDITIYAISINYNQRLDCTARCMFLFHPFYF
jgi:hypothetical protein